MLVILVLMFVVAALAPRIFITIQSGHGGILWQRFFGGTQTSQIALGEGLHIIFPWDYIFIYDMRVQEQDHAYEVITREGLQVTVRSSFRWHLNRATLPKLHKEIGPNYLNVLLIPEVGSVLRERVSQYKIDEIFSSKRTHIQQEVLDGIVSETPGQSPNRIGRESTKSDDGDFVTMTDVLFKDMTLPDRLKSAIERKLEQAQISEEYTFRIEREKLESQRKLIEAQGIQAFQQTVQAGISENYLKWRGIEATLQLATSTNSKVVVVGGGSNGLPLILNTDDGASRAPPPNPPRIPSPETTKARSAPAWKVEARQANDQDADAQSTNAQEADAENAGKFAGSINMTPAGPNVSMEQLANPQAKAAGPADPLRSYLGATDTEGPDAPPYILRSFADAFGYRLQRIDTPASASNVGPNGAPR